MLKKIFTTILLFSLITSNTFANVGLDFENRFEKNGNEFLVDGQKRIYWKTGSRLPGKELSDSSVYSVPKIGNDGIFSDQGKTFFYPTTFLPEIKDSDGKQIWPLGKDYRGNSNTFNSVPINGNTFYNTFAGTIGKVDVGSSETDYGYTATKFNVPIDKNLFNLGGYWISDNTRKIKDESFVKVLDVNGHSNNVKNNTTDLLFQLYDFRSTSRIQDSSGNNKYASAGSYMDGMFGNDITEQDKLIYAPSEDTQGVAADSFKIPTSMMVNESEANLNYGNKGSRATQGIGMEIYYENPRTGHRVSFDYEIADEVGGDGKLSYRPIGHRIGSQVKNVNERAEVICVPKAKEYTDNDGKYYKLEKVGYGKQIDSIEKDETYTGMIRPNNYLGSLSTNTCEPGFYPSIYHRNIITSFEEGIANEDQFSWSKEIRLKFTVDKILELRKVIGMTAIDGGYNGYFDFDEVVDAEGKVAKDSDGNLLGSSELDNINLTVKVFAISRPYRDALKGTGYDPTKSTYEEKYENWLNQRIYEYAYVADRTMGMVNLDGEQVNDMIGEREQAYYSDNDIRGTLPAVGMSSRFAIAFKNGGRHENITNVKSRMNDLLQILDSGQFTNGDSDRTRVKQGFLTKFQSHMISELGGFNGIQLADKYGGSSVYTNLMKDLPETDSDLLGQFIPFILQKGQSHFKMMTIDADSQNYYNSYLDNNRVDLSAGPQPTPTGQNPAVSIYHLEKGTLPSLQDIDRGVYDVNIDKLAQGQMLSILTPGEDIMPLVNEIKNEAARKGYPLYRDSSDGAFYKTNLQTINTSEGITYHKNRNLVVNVESNKDGSSYTNTIINSNGEQLYVNTLNIGKDCMSDDSSHNCRYEKRSTNFNGGNNFGFSAAHNRDIEVKPGVTSPLVLSGTTLTSYGVSITQWHIMDIIGEHNIEKYFGSSCYDKYKSGDYQTCSLNKEFKGHFALHGLSGENAVSYMFNFDIYEPALERTKKPIAMGVRSTDFCSFYDDGTGTLTKLNRKEDCSDIKIRDLYTNGQIHQDSGVDENLDLEVIEFHGDVDENDPTIVKNPTSQLLDGQVGYLEINKSNQDNYLIVAKVHVANIDPYMKKYNNIKVTSSIEGSDNVKFFKWNPLTNKIEEDTSEGGVTFTPEMRILNAFNIGKTGITSQFIPYSRINEDGENEIHNYVKANGEAGLLYPSAKGEPITDYGFHDTSDINAGVIPNTKEGAIISEYDGRDIIYRATGNTDPDGFDYQYTAYGCFIDNYKGGLIPYVNASDPLDDGIACIPDFASASEANAFLASNGGLKRYDYGNYLMNRNMLHSIAYEVPFKFNFKNETDDFSYVSQTGETLEIGDENINGFRNSSDRPIPTKIVDKFIGKSTYTDREKFKGSTNGFLNDRFASFAIKVQSFDVETRGRGAKAFYEYYSGEDSIVGQDNLVIGIGTNKDGSGRPQEPSGAELDVYYKSTTPNNGDTIDGDGNGKVQVDICIKNKGKKDIYKARISKAIVLNGISSFNGTVEDESLINIPSNVDGYVDLLKKGDKHCETKELIADVTKVGQDFSYQFTGKAWYLDPTSTEAVGTEFEGYTVIEDSTVNNSHKITGGTICSGDIKNDPNCHNVDFDIRKPDGGGQCIDKGSTHEYNLKIRNGLENPIYEVEIEFIPNEKIEIVGGNFYKDPSSGNYKRKISVLDAYSTEANSSIKIRNTANAEEGEPLISNFNVYYRNEAGGSRLLMNNKAVSSSICQDYGPINGDGVTENDRDFVSVQVMHTKAGDDSNKENQNSGPLAQIPTGQFFGGNKDGGYLQNPGINAQGDGMTSIKAGVCSVYNKTADLNPELPVERTIKANYHRVQFDPKARGTDYGINWTNIFNEACRDDCDLYGKSFNYNYNGGNNDLRESTKRVIYRNVRIDWTIELPKELEIATSSFKSSDEGNSYGGLVQNGPVIKENCEIRKDVEGNDIEVCDKTYLLTQNLNTLGDNYPVGDSSDGSTGGQHDSNWLDDVQKRVEGLDYQTDEKQRKNKTEPWKYITFTVKPVEGSTINAIKEANDWSKYIKVSGTLKAKREIRKVIDKADEKAGKGTGLCSKSSTGYGESKPSPAGIKHNGRYETHVWYTYERKYCGDGDGEDKTKWKCLSDSNTSISGREYENVRTGNSCGDGDAPKKDFGPVYGYDLNYHVDTFQGQEDFSTIAKGTAYRGTIGQTGEDTDVGAFTANETSVAVENKAGVILDICSAGVALCVIGGDVYTTNTFDLSGVNKLDKRALEYNIYTGQGVIGGNDKVKGDNYSKLINYVFEDPTGTKADKLRNPEQYCDYINPLTGEHSPELNSGTCKTTFFQDLKTGKKGKVVKLEKDTAYWYKHFNLSNQLNPLDDSGEVKDFVTGGNDIVWYREGDLVIGKDTSKNIEITGKGTVFVDGDLYINSNLYYRNNKITSSLAGNIELDSALFVVSGNIYISPDVTFVAPAMAAMGLNSTYYSCGNIDQRYECTTRNPLIIGKLTSRYFRFDRPSTNMPAYIRLNTPACTDAVDYYHEPSCFEKVSKLSSSECILDDNRDVINPPSGMLDIRKSDLFRFELAPGDRSVDKGFFNRFN